MKRLTAIMLTSLALYCNSDYVGAGDRWRFAGRLPPATLSGIRRISPASTTISMTTSAPRTIDTTITEGNKLQEPNGVAYTTNRPEERLRLR